ncbi:MAG: TerB family tellurite resistance protein [Deltaproteobacteria bacterium]|nr:TerB family tellurite resistance protein [Deltaproteobacteria bacterium]
MFNNLEEFFKTGASLVVDKTGQPTPSELRIATVCLLIKAGSLDGYFHSDEFDSLVSTLNREFELSNEEAGYNLEVGGLLVDDEVKIESFIKAINANFEESQKVAIIAMMWRVMLADGLVSSHEAAFASRTAKLLGLNQKHIELARDMIEDGQV